MKFSSTNWFSLGILFLGLEILLLGLGIRFPDFGIIFPSVGMIFPGLGILFSAFGILFPGLGIRFSGIPRVLYYLKHKYKIYTINRVFLIKSEYTKKQLFKRKFFLNNLP